MTIGVNAINLFDQKTVTGLRQATPYRDGFNVADATFFGGFDPGRGGGGAAFRDQGSGQVRLPVANSGIWIRRSFAISSGSPLECEQDGFLIPDP